jgi:hypothetical protein
MTDQAAEAALPARQAALPRSAAIIEAFRSDTEPADELLRLAVRLAHQHQHQHQWAAETVSRDPSATAEQIAASKRTIDTLNDHRAELIELLDEHIAARISTGAAQVPLHTETAGSVIDRLGIAWVRSNNLLADGPRERARQALDQLRGLATAYDDLVREITQGTRRVPAWRLLKQYEGAS